MKSVVMVAVVVALAGCSRETENRRPGTGNGQRAAGDVRKDGRSQRELAEEIAEAEQMGKQAERRYGEIRKSWLRKRVTWKLDVVGALCRSADACHALAFDRLGADRAVVQGWMPRLRLTADTFAALQARCAGRARCPVTLEATVSDLSLSVDEPTSLTLADVRLLDGLAANR